MRSLNLTLCGQRNFWRQCGKRCRPLGTGTDLRRGTASRVAGYNLDLPPGGSWRLTKRRDQHFATTCLPRLKRKPAREGLFTSAFGDRSKVPRKGDLLQLDTERSSHSAWTADIRFPEKYSERHIRHAQRSARAARSVGAIERQRSDGQFFSRVSRRIAQQSSASVPLNAIRSRRVARPKSKPAL
jgi:hypothetical protein